jgi:hypothetical protein
MGVYASWYHYGPEDSDETWESWPYLAINITHKKEIEKAKETLREAERIIRYGPNQTLDQFLNY